MSDWKAVAQVVNDRMRVLDLTQRELAERSGVSVATLRKIQQGVEQRRSVTTLAAISRALGLADGHLRRIASSKLGSDAAGSVGGQLAERVERLEAELAQMRERVAALESEDRA